MGKLNTCAGAGLISLVFLSRSVFAEEPPSPATTTPNFQPVSTREARPELVDVKLVSEPAGSRFCVRRVETGTSRGTGGTLSASERRGVCGVAPDTLSQDGAGSTRPGITGDGLPGTLSCAAPCVTSIPSGEYWVGMAPAESGKFAFSGSPVVIGGPGILQGTYQSKFATRRAGAVILGSGGLLVAAGIAVVAIAAVKQANYGLAESEAEDTCIATARQNCNNVGSPPPTRTTLAVGSALVVGGVAGIVTGAVMLSQGRNASVRFLLGVPAVGAYPTGGKFAGTDILGGTLQVRF